MLLFFICSQEENKKGMKAVRQRERVGSEKEGDSPLGELSSNISVFTSLALGKVSLPSLYAFMLRFVPPIEKDSILGLPVCPLRGRLGRKIWLNPSVPLVNREQTEPWNQFEEKVTNFVVMEMENEDKQMVKQYEMEGALMG